jgi:hypothetical protein
MDQRVAVLLLEIVPPPPNDKRGGYKLRLSLVAIDPMTGEKRGVFVMRDIAEWNGALSTPNKAVNVYNALENPTEYVSSKISPIVLQWVFKDNSSLYEKLLLSV